MNPEKINRIRQHPIFRAGFVILLFLLLPPVSLYAVSQGQGDLDYDLDLVFEVSLDYFSETGFFKSLGIEHTPSVSYNPLDCTREQQREQRCPAQYGGNIDIRWTRVVAAGLIGAGLAIAGASIQGIFRNPLADPSIIGVSGGAVIGATLAIWQGFNAKGLLAALPDIQRWNIVFTEIDGEIFGQLIAAFLGGLVFTAAVYRVARFRGRTDITTLLLIGLAINTIASAFVGMVSSLVGREKVGTINTWMFGGVSYLDWQDIYVAAPFILISIILLPVFSRQLNLMALGESDARHLGVNVEVLRISVICLAALTVGISVAFAGIIAFVGLLIPQLIRIIAGPDHYVLLPASAAGGAIFLILADLFARTVDDLSEIPLGSVTTLVGGPFFLLLIVIYFYRGSRI